MRARAAGPVRWCLTIGIIPIAAGRAAGQDRVPSPTAAFVGVSVLTMENDRVQPNWTVVVRDGRIDRVGPAGEIEVPKGATRIDGAGKFLIPGLADMHVHFGQDSSVNEALLKLYVAHGVTKVLNMHGSPLHLRMRGRVAKGELLGPTIYTAGPIVGDSTVPFEKGEKIVDDYRAAGYDFVKVYNLLAREGYRGITTAAKRVGIPVMGHILRGLDPDGLSQCEPTKSICHCPNCLETTLASGQIAVVHIEEFMYTELDYHPTKNPKDVATLEPDIPAMARQVAAAGVWVIPTLEAYRRITAQIENLARELAVPETQWVPAQGRKLWDVPENTYLKRYKPADAVPFWQAYRLQEKMAKGFHQAGVRLMAGTDVGLPTIVAGHSLHGDIQNLFKAGLSPYEALVTATANPGVFAKTILKGSDESGTISPGTRADLVLLDGNPLSDVTQTTKIRGVMVRGRWLARAELDRLLEELARANRTATGS